MKIINFSKKDKLSREERLIFLDYLKASLENGFSLASSIELMPLIWPEKQLLMTKIDQDMKAGAKFGDELLKLGFAKTTILQLNLALQQGNLVECLSQLTILSRLKNEQIKKIGVELSYPFVLAGMMVLLLLFMQTFVISQFDDGQKNSGDLLLVGLLLLTFGFVYYLLRNLALLNKQDFASLKKLSKSKLIGKTIRTYAAYLLVYDIGMLLAGGFSLQKMCQYAAEQDEGSLQQYLGQKIRHELSEGKALEEIIKQEDFLPESLLFLIHAGSKREKLSKSCLVLGNSLFKDLTGQIEKLVVSVQPACFIVLGLCILGMYLKLLLPMYAMMRGI